jgi:hypothetical protein
MRRPDLANKRTQTLVFFQSELPPRKAVLVRVP